MRSWSLQGDDVTWEHGVGAVSFRCQERLAWHCADSEPRVRHQHVPLDLWGGLDGPSRAERTAGQLERSDRAN